MLILLFIYTGTSFPQKFIFKGQIGSFNSASSLSINSAGILYVADTEKNEIIKIDTLGKVIKTIGGYGWQESSFDDPEDVFANLLNVYVADKNNDRIQMFDKDLNFLSSFKRSDNSSADNFRYPTGVVVSNQGDLFILDSDNSRIIKYNSRGEFQLLIGSNDAGNFVLSNPKRITITNNQKLIVADGNCLVIFDQFGSGTTKLDLDFEPSNINSTFQNICVTDGKKIYFADKVETLTELTSSAFNPELESEIEDALLFNSKLYILIKQTILIYQSAK
jgi:hypothetical protein